jgi:hypothetical protein
LVHVTADAELVAQREQIVDRLMSALGHSLPMRLVPRLARCPEYPESRHEAPAQYLTRWAKSRHWPKFVLLKSL